MKKLPKIQFKNIPWKKILPFVVVIFLVPIFTFFVLPTLRMWYARAAATIYWDGGAGTSNWSDAQNWNTDVVPVATDEVLIDVATTVSITDPITITSLTLGKSAGTTATVLSFNYDAITLGALTVSTGDFILYPGASVTHAAGNGASIVGKINIDVQTGNATILGSIDVDSKGYAAGEGPGAGTDGQYGSGGGAYGGNGGKGATHAGGIAYGNPTQPTDLGSGGGVFGPSGAGGGAVKLTVTGTTTINGTISSNGGYGEGGYWEDASGGGAGGSIWITTNTLTGSGIVRANGGNTPNKNRDGGAGSGGRIALYYSTDSSSFATLSANTGTSGDGAQYSGAGTIYKKSTAQTNGDLIVDNNGSGWSTDRNKFALTPLGNITLDNLTITDFSSTDYSNTMSVTSTITLSNYSHLKNTGSISTNTLSISTSAWYYNETGSNTTYSTLNWTGGTITDNGGNMTIFSGSSALTIPSGGTLIGNTTRTFSNITVNGTLTHDVNGTTDVNKLNYTSTGDLTINSGGQINVDSKGYAPSEGPGAGTDHGHGGGGAAHAGIGGKGQETGLGGTSTYGDVYQPTTLGSGGGTGSTIFTYGGGAIKLTVTGTTTVNGSITAKGGYATSGSWGVLSGGGAGGSIWITTNTLTGSGTISASGGSTQNNEYDGGGGGGGRIALYYSTDTSVLSTLSANGGTAGDNAQYGGAGTIYKKSTAQTNGDLIVDNNGTTGWSTVKDRIPQTPLGNMTLDNLTIADYSNINYSNTMSVTSTITLSNYSHLKNTGSISTNTLSISTSAWYYNETGSNTTYSTLNWTGGTITDNGGTMNLVSGGGDLTVPATSTLAGNVARTFTNITVNGTLTHDVNGTTDVNKLNYTSTGDLTINSGGQINVDSKGYAAGEGPGAGTDHGHGGGGAAHAGIGGNGQEGALGGTSTYGDVYQPTTLGSGGGIGTTTYPSAGGGAVKLTVTGTTTVNGSITARGGFAESGPWAVVSGAGAGGSIWITTNTLTGSGTISASGGNTRNGDYDGGGGGGGRVALYYSSDSSAFADLSVNGGTSGNASQPGTVGTLYEGGIPGNPVNLNQFKADKTTGIGIGASTNESSIIVTFGISDPNTSDTLTPQVEIQPIGTVFSNVATHTGNVVSYTGGVVSAEVSVNGIADGSSYHWQARVCDVTNLCSDWVSFGNNAESEADIRVVMNTNPNSPTIPTSSFYINGQYTNNLQPTLGFVLSDPNTVDSVGYIIEVSTVSDFNTTIISYTSAMAAQGTQSFTVGQAVGEGTYTTGTEGQELVTGDYYWRVKVVDDKAGSSDWSVASGTPSFKIDLSRPTNASNVYMKSSIASTDEYTLADGNKWFRRNDLYFAWDAASDVQGIKGYCLYVGTDPNGDPATEKGLLGSSPVSTTGTTCQFITDGTEIDFSNSALRSYEWLTSSNDPYYFKVKAIDIANNTFVGPDDTNYVSFNFDNTAPQNVTAISTPSIAFSSVADMFFSWSTGTAGSSDDHSGVLGFQYAINTKDTWWGNTQDTFTGLTYSPMDREQPLYLPTEVHSSIQLGQNTVYFRVLDNAGNYSELRTAILNYGGEAPSFAQGAEVTVTPAQNTTNTFAFSWPAAQASTGNTVATYYYMINTPPPVSYATITSNSATYIATTGTSIAETVIPGLRKGANTIYIAVVDNAGNYSSSNVISATFYLNSDLPDSPADVTVADISIKDVSIWRAAVVWSEPVYKGTGSLTYHVYRSEDATNWTEIATTTGLTYVDTVPESKEYFWRVASTDNSDESISSPSVSNGASLTPRGKYLEPPTLTSGPASSSISTTKSTISWTTSRNSDSKVAFGLKSREYFESESYNSTETTEHKIVLSNLTPGTQYYYTAKWTDEDGNTGESQELSFATEPAPEVKNVRISNRGVSSSMINFTTIKASSVKIYYGISTSFGGVKEIATSKLETSYSLQLDQLQDGTKYYFKINTMDEEGKEYEGTILDFETLPRPKVFNIKVMQVAKTAQSALLVSWNSNTEISSVVTYYPSSNQSLMRDNVDLELISGEHEMLIKGLFPDTEYSIQVRGNDLIGNEAVSEVINIKTSRDSRAPQISAMTLEGTNVRLTDGGTTSQLIVSWNTDEPSTSQVEYGEGSGDNYNQLTQEDKDLSYNHVVIISGLTPSKVYHLRAISADSAANVTKSIDTVTITPKATDNALYLVITTLKEAFGFIDQIDNL